MLRVRAVNWVREQGIEPGNQPDWSEDGVPHNTHVTALEEDREVISQFITGWLNDEENAFNKETLPTELAKSLTEQFWFKARS